MNIENLINTINKKNAELDKFVSDSMNPNSIFDLNQFCHSFPTVLGNYSKENQPTHNFFRKNRITDNNQALMKVLSREKESLKFKYSNNKITPEFNFFEKEYDSKNLIFSNDIVWNGQIQSFTGWKNILERVGEFGYNKRRFESDGFSNTPLVLTQTTISPHLLSKQNEHILPILFEEYQCPMMLLCSQALLNLLSFNQTSGIVVDLGESGTQISPISDGFTQYNNSLYSPLLSGRNMNLIHYYEKVFKHEFLSNDLAKNEISECMAKNFKIFFLYTELYYNYIL